MGFGDLSRTDWASVEGTKFSMGRKGEGEALLPDLGVGAGEDKLLWVLSSIDFIHDSRLFRCSGNDLLRLLVPFFRCSWLIIVEKANNTESVFGIESYSRTSL